MHEIVTYGAGWLWVVVALAIICLGAAIIYGSTMWRHRRKDRTIKDVRDEVTREHYKSSEGQRP